MNSTIHTYQKGNDTFQMHITTYDYTLMQTKSGKGIQTVRLTNNQSAATPSKLTFFIKCEDEFLDITSTIHKELKDEIIRDYWKDHLEK